jgi:hypothetical protein
MERTMNAWNVQQPLADAIAELGSQIEGSVLDASDANAIRAFAEWLNGWLVARRHSRIGAMEAARIATAKAERAYRRIPPESRW